MTKKPMTLREQLMAASYDGARYDAALARRRFSEATSEFMRDYSELIGYRRSDGASAASTERGDGE